jgi:hypothetical protein
MQNSNLFLRRSQASSRNNGSSSSSSTAVASSRFQNRKRNHHHHHHHHNNHQSRQQHPPPKQGSEAVAVESQQVNAKTFKYPPEGFVTPIEHTLLYTMIREASIFPPETVLEAIDQEDYTQYFYVNEKEKKHSGIVESQQQQQQQEQQPHHHDSDYQSSTTTAAHSISNSASASASATNNISYAQLTAILALSGEEWSDSTKVPERLCQAISKQIVKYANQHDLDRRQELKELIDPLLDYANNSRTKQSLRLLPWFAALTVSTISPLAFYATYMSMIAVNGENIAKRDMADRNTIDIAELSSRKANVEQASLLDEDYNDHDDDHDDDHHHNNHK